MLYANGSRAVTRGNGVDPGATARALTVIEGLGHDGSLVLGQGISWDPDVFSLLSDGVVVAVDNIDLKSIATTNDMGK